MKFLVFDPPPKPPETKEGIAIQEMLLNQLAPLFALALSTGILTPDPTKALGLLLFNRQDPPEQVAVLAQVDGTALYLVPARTSPYWDQWFKRGCRFPPVTTPAAWEGVMHLNSWFCAWQLVIGGPSCAGGEA